MPKKGSYYWSYLSSEGSILVRDERIRRLRESDPETWTYGKLAKEFGMSRSAVCKVCNPEKYKKPGGRYLRKLGGSLKRSIDREIEKIEKQS